MERRTYPLLLKVALYIKANTCAGTPALANRSIGVSSPSCLLPYNFPLYLLSTSWYYVSSVSVRTSLSLVHGSLSILLITSLLTSSIRQRELLI
jgi:hypothetical protein